MKKWVFIIIFSSATLGCGIKQLEEAKEEFVTAREQIEQQAAAEERELTEDEKLLLKYSEASEKALQDIIDKKLEGLSTVGAVGETAVGLLPPPWNLGGGLLLGLLGLGRARKTRSEGKALAKAVVEAVGDDGKIDLTSPEVKRNLARTMGSGGNKLIQEAKGLFKTSPL